MHTVSYMHSNTFISLSKEKKKLTYKNYLKTYLSWQFQRELGSYSGRSLFIQSETNIFLSNFRDLTRRTRYHLAHVSIMQTFFFFLSISLIEIA